MKAHKLIWTLLFLAPNTPWASDKIISLDQSHFVAASPDARVHLKPKKIAGVVEEGAGLRIYPKARGRFQLSIDGYTRSYQVLLPADFQLYQKLEQFLGARMGLEIRIFEGRILLEGRLLRFRDFVELSELAQSTGGTYLLNTKVDPDIAPQLKNYVQDQLQAKNLRYGQIRTEPTASVQFSEQNRKYKEQIARTLDPLGIPYDFVEGELSTAPLVHVQMTIAEVSRSLQQDLGIKWPTEANFQLTPKWSGRQSLEALLKAAKDEGRAQILASPQLISKSGGTSEFLAGGEFPVRITQRLRKDIYWKRHGIYLKIKPLADYTGKLQIELEAEISMPAPSYEGETIPSIKTNRLTSQFDLEKSQTIVLSGLVQDLRGLSKSGLALFSDLPVLGRLFRSESFHNNKSELVIFVTPQVVNPGNGQAPRLPKDFDDVDPGH